MNKKKPTNPKFEKNVLHFTKTTKMSYNIKNKNAKQIQLKLV